MDLFSASNKEKKVKEHGAPSYNAQDIEVLEGLDPVRLRPGMYIGGTNSHALHHLFTEIIDNAMDEAVAGHAKHIHIYLNEDNSIKIRDDGRGIPVDPHPKYPNKSAVEVILTTLHSGGKFSGKAYRTSGGLHGVGLSVVNALSERLIVTVHRNAHRYTQTYSRGKPLSGLTAAKCSAALRGTEIEFLPDPEIFGPLQFDPLIIHKLTCARGYLYRGVTIEWHCAPEICPEGVPHHQIIHYPEGLRDFIVDLTKNTDMVTPEIFSGMVDFSDSLGKAEWAISWQAFEDGFTKCYCNTVFTPQGGTHETGFKTALLKALKHYGEIIGNNRISHIVAEDIFNSAFAILSVFVENPIFQGQTKEKLLSAEVQKIVENAIRPQFENWLAASPRVANLIIDKVLQDADERLSRKKSKEVARKNPIKSLRLPGKLVDCLADAKRGSEIFLVEGESAGGSAKQARNREFQAILPLKGKILNVASSSRDKILANAEIRDLITALGCSLGKDYNHEDLRYERVIIMTDADVDGAHITSLLLTFFYQQMPKLIENGHLYLAQPPLYKLVYQNKVYYAAHDQEMQHMLNKWRKNAARVEISRFKGLGEMTAAQLKETTMDPTKRILLKVCIENDEYLSLRVRELMGKDAEPRFRFIKEKSAQSAEHLETIVDV